MTKVRIEPGICGFTAIAEAEAAEKGKVLKTAQDNPIQSAVLPLPGFRPKNLHPKRRLPPR